MTSGVILSFFLIITILDCIHINRPANSSLTDPIVSVLDLTLTPLILNTETTYSAPFAIISYSKDSITLNGKATRDFKRLEHAGSHLESSQKRSTDIIQKSLTGITGSLLFITILLFIFITQFAKKRKFTKKAAWHVLIKKQTEIAWRSGWICFSIILLTLGFVIAIAPYYHILGTDKVGEDILYQSLKSIRTGVLIGTLSTLFMLPFALLLGMMAGYFRGWVDDVIQYIYTTLSSIPGVLLIVAAILIVDIQFADVDINANDKADLKLLFLCIILGLTSWTGLCRLLRAETLKLRELDYIQAAHAFGIHHFSILLRHIFPNVMHLVLISIAIDFSGLVLAEAVLSYIGVGVDPTMNSWGNMVNGARMEMARDPMVWWTLMAAFFFMLTLVLSANFFADAIRDAFDPKMRERS
ncbi:MAG: ABC transporter permease, partial [Methylococcales bacterium]|nr:ABC transporter permease [Methylococcales bacterium]